MIYSIIEDETPQEGEKEMKAKKAKIEIESTDGEVFEIEREVGMCGTVAIGYGVIPLKEVGAWIPRMFPGTRVRNVSIVG